MEINNLSRMDSIEQQLKELRKEMEESIARYTLKEKAISKYIDKAGIHLEIATAQLKNSMWSSHFRKREYWGWGYWITLNDIFDTEEAAMSYISDWVNRTDFV